MRIIGGIHKGKVLKVSKGLPVRPTTDFAKEALFNILQNKFEIETLSILDLFSGTGHISLEFASRGCQNVMAVDKHFACVGFLRQQAKELNLPIYTTKSDVFDFLKKCNTQYSLIFADPPYDLENINEIHALIFKNNLLKSSGTLIIEHGAKTALHELLHFTQHRKYGNVNFSFFEFD